MAVIAAGTTGSNVGYITATAATDGTVTAQINPGNNQTLMAIYTVPAGRTAFMTNYYSSIIGAAGANKTSDLSLFVKPDADQATAVWQLKHIVSKNTTGTSYLIQSFKPYFTITEKSDIKLQTTSDTNNTIVAGGFDLVLRDN
jgi:hypothetical protein